MEMEKGRESKRGGMEQGYRGNMRKAQGGARGCQLVEERKRFLFLFYL